MQASQASTATPTARQPHLLTNRHAAARSSSLLPRNPLYLPPAVNGLVKTNIMGSGGQRNYSEKPV